MNTDYHVTNNYRASGINIELYHKGGDASLQPTGRACTF